MPIIAAAVALITALLASTATAATTDGPNRLFAGGSNTCALIPQGALKCWGANNRGQLGLGDLTSRGRQAGQMGDALSAIDLGTGTVTEVAIGNSHICALRGDRSVLCWGRNTWGQLGQGDTDNRGDGPDEMGEALRPVDLGSGRTARTIAAGANHTCALLDDDTVKCWGHNVSGQLGLGDTAHRGDDPGEMGDDLPAVELGTGRTAQAIAASYSNTCALLDDRTVKCWGGNGYGQLGQGDMRYRGIGPNEMGDHLRPVALGTGRTAKAITGGVEHVCALLDDDTVKCWGHNGDGRLGQGDTSHRGVGPDEMGDELRPVDVGPGRTVRTVVAGGSHTCVLLDDGAVRCWGSNLRGQLGQGDARARGTAPGQTAAISPIELGTGRRATAITAGNYHTCALLDDGAFKCWGWNTDGELGLPGLLQRGDLPEQMGDRLPMPDIGRQSVASIAAGGSHTCALGDDGGLRCWGANAIGQLGQGDTTDRGVLAGQLGAELPLVALSAGGSVQAVAAGLLHTCALLAAGDVACWGWNGYGQLGQGDTVDRGGQPGDAAQLRPVDVGSDRAATAIAAGDHHSCALLDDGAVACWGWNDNGQLGLGDRDDRGDQPTELGDALATVNLGNDRTAKAITAGSRHTCALLDNDTVTCWGWNGNGQLGLGDRDDRGDQPTELGDALATVNLGNDRTAKAITAGSRHTCALLDNDTVTCWGSNYRGQLGQDDTRDRGVAAHEMRELRPVAIGSGRVAAAVTAGGDHTCVLRDDGRVSCWGWNLTGQLGEGGTRDRGDRAGEMGDALPTVDLGSERRARSISAGTAHTCALLDDGAVKCWGWNGRGQLGLGDLDSRGDRSGDLGDALPPARLDPVRLRDGIAPVIGAQMAAGWRRAPVTVTLSAADPGHGSGLRALRFAIASSDDPAPDPFGPDGVVYDPSDPPILEHDRWLRYAAEDRSGNRSTRFTRPARIDAVAPTAADDVPTRPAERAHSVTLTADDDRSGVAEIRYATGAAPADPSGPDGRIYDPGDRPTLRPGERIRYLAVDRAGNASPERTATLHAPLPAPAGPPPDEVGAPRADGPKRPTAASAPVANAVVTRLTPPRRGGARRYRLDATLSSSPGGRIVRFRWTIDGRTVSSRAATVVTLAARRAAYRVVLTVTDHRGRTHRSRVSVLPPRAPDIRVVLPSRGLLADGTVRFTRAGRRTIDRLRALSRGAARITVTGRNRDRRAGRRHAAAVAAAVRAGVTPRPVTRVTAGPGKTPRITVTIKPRR